MYVKDWDPLRKSRKPFIWNCGFKKPFMVVLCKVTLFCFLSLGLHVNKWFSSESIKYMLLMKQHDVKWSGVQARETDDEVGYKGVCVCSVMSDSLRPVNCIPPMGCSPPGSSVHGIFQARRLEWVAISFSRGIKPRDQTQASCGSWTAGRFFTIWATREALE